VLAQPERRFQDVKDPSKAELYEITSPDGYKVFHVFVMINLKRFDAQIPHVF
jgi:ppGpp synthetase/RelA/SpoT-type nucleotidyltranferase